MAFGSFNPAKADQIASQIVNAAISAGFTPPNIGSDYDKALLVLANMIPALPLRLGFGGGIADTIYAQFTPLNSPAGGTPTLRTVTFPAKTFEDITASVSLSAGLMVIGYGTFANNAAAKTVVLKIGTSGSPTTINTVTATASVANSWFHIGFMGISSNTAQTCVGFGAQGNGTPTFTVANPAALAVNLTTTALDVTFTGTQTSAADIIQNGALVLAL